MTTQAVLVDPSSGLQLPLQSAAGGATTRAKVGAMCQCATAVGAVTVQVPLAPSEGQTFGVSDVDGNASVNNITVAGAGQLIDGVANVVIAADGGNAFFMFDRAQWRRMQSVRRIDNPPAPGPLLVQFTADDLFGVGVVLSVAGTPPITSSGGANPAIGITPATGGARGSMSAADKTKLDTMTAGAAVASVGGTAPIASSGGAAPTISIVAATGAVPGSMSAADKGKLDGIQSQGPTTAMAAFDVDWSLSGTYSKALANGANVITFSNTADGESVVVQLTGDPGGSTVTWPAGVQWAGGAAPTQTATGKDIYSFVRIGAVVNGSVLQAFA